MATPKEDREPIYYAADRCDKRFQDLLTLLKGQGGIGNFYLKVRDYYQRFESWAGFIGAFAEPEAALDHRLRLYPEVRELVLQMFQLLETNLQYEFWLNPSSRGTENEPVLENAELGKNLTGHDIVAESSIVSAARASLGAMEEAIDRLQRLATIIRQASTSSLAPRVRAFAHKTDAVDNAKFERISLLFVTGRFRGIDEELAKQLAASISYRRLRLLYIRRHQLKLEKRRSTGQTTESNPGALPQTTSSGTFDQGTLIKQTPKTIESSANSLKNRAYSVTNPSEFDSTKFHKHYMEEAEERLETATVTSVSHAYTYPHQPNVEKDADSSVCDWCSKRILASNLNIPGWWKSHFKNDLEPYVCISEECFEPAVYFTSFSKWRRHMEETHTSDWARKIHGHKVWYCDSAPGEYHEFPSAEQLGEHLKSSHPTTFTPAQLKRKLTRNILSSTRKENICPLCSQDILAFNNIEQKSVSDRDEKGKKKQQTAKSSKRVKFEAADGISSSEDEESPLKTDRPPQNPEDNTDERNREAEKLANRVKLSRHVAEHLKSLAFISIRYIEDEDGSDDAGKSSLGAVGEGSNEEFLIDKFPEEAEDPLVFEDIPLDERKDVDMTEKNSEEEMIPGKTFRVESSLADRLYEARIESPVGRHTYFIPINDIERLINPVTIIKELHRIELDSRDVDNILATSRKLFAILVCIHRTDAIIDFYREGLDDQDLPLISERSIDKNRAPMRDFELRSHLRTHQPIQFMDRWEANDRQYFDRVQWFMLAPVFTDPEVVRHYEFRGEQVMPYIEDNEGRQSAYGSFSSVWSVLIHPAHQFICKGPDPKNPNVKIAIKRLFSRDKREFTRKVSMLKAFSNHNHRHLVKLLATYTIGEQYHFMFPYASDNLRTFWKRTPPTLEPSMAKWVLTQCHGLASALCQIHVFQPELSSTNHADSSGEDLLGVYGDTGNYDSPNLTHERIYGRHGNIKAENILYYQENGSGGLEIGPLVLSGFGLMSFRTIETRDRVPSQSIHGSPTYAPPEVRMEDIFISPEYDIWSLGCVYLEFVTWFLLGNEGVEQFADARGLDVADNINDDTYYTLSEDRRSATVRQGVTDWITRLHQNPRCSRLTTVLLNLIEHNMLVIYPGHRISARRLQEVLLEMINTAAGDETYLVDPVHPALESSPEAPVKIGQGYSGGPVRMAKWYFDRGKELQNMSTTPETARHRSRSADHKRSKTDYGPSEENTEAPVDIMISSQPSIATDNTEETFNDRGKGSVGHESLEIISPSSDENMENRTEVLERENERSGIAEQNEEA